MYLATCLIPCKATTAYQKSNYYEAKVTVHQITHTHTHPLNGPFLGLPRCAGTRKVKPIWILTVSGSGISWAICKSAPHSRQITTPAPHHSVFYRPDAFLPPNQQRQSTEGTSSSNQSNEFATYPI